MSEKPADAKPDEKKAPTKGKGKKDKDMDIKKDEISEADLKIKTEVELCVTRLSDADPGIIGAALDTLTGMLCVATGTVTGIPKPLKFLRPQAPVLKALIPKVSGNNKLKLCDILAVVVMTLEQREGETEVLNWKLQGNAVDLTRWGHEFVRHIAGEIGVKWNALKENDESTDELVPLVNEIVLFEVKHAGEAHACDLLLEIEEIGKIFNYVDESNYTRICQYLLSVAQYTPEPDDIQLYKISGQFFEKFGAYADSLRVALKIGDSDVVMHLFKTCPSDILRCQMALICGHHKFFVTTGDSELDAIIGNNFRSALFNHTARDMDSLEPKTPEDIVKSHLMDQRTNLAANVPSYMRNLANVFVSCLGNAGFSRDKLISEKGTDWVYGQKEDKAISAVASVGLVYLWNHEEGLNMIDKFFVSEAPYIKPGACLGIGLMFTGVRSEFDPAFSMLEDNVRAKDKNVRLTSVLGLAMAYAGTRDARIHECLTPIVADASEDVELQSFAALALGIVFAASCHEDIAETVTTCIMEKTPEQLNHASIRYMILGLSLLFLGRQEAAETLIETSKSLPPKIQLFTELALTTAAYAGSGNVMQIQRFLSIVGETASEGDKKDKDKDKDEKEKEPTEEEKQKAELEAPLDHRVVAVLGLGLVSLGEDVGRDMCRRMLDHVLQFGGPSARRGIPLALALMSVSNPQVPVLESLAKLSHDTDKPTAQNAILAIGIVSAGTNNARAATMLRNLASFYAKDTESLFLTHVALGLVFLGKGHITLSPVHSDRFLVSPVAVSGLLTLMYTMLDAKRTLFDRYHFMLYTIATAMSPRMTTMVDKDLKPVQLQVRVGTAVDTVATAGKQKTITGFQTHNSPVLLQHSDRVDVPRGKLRPCCSVVEGIIIVEDNPENPEE
jgi:26S proteasome regulatory subunit N1